MRISKEQNYMNLATEIARRSHDIETQVGAILVKNDSDAIIATGFNGFVRGAPDSELPNTRPDKYPYMQHAEVNIVTNCARHGISMDNSRIYVTLSPCLNCMRTLWQSGITQVICKEMYGDFSKILEMKDLKVTINEDETTGFYHLKYEV